VVAVHEVHTGEDALRVSFHGSPLQLKL